MMVTVTQVPNEMIARIWPQVVPHMEKGRKHWEDFYGMEDFLTACMKGDMQLWVYIQDKKIEAVLFTSLLRYPRATYLRYLYAGGGGLRVWKNYAYIVEDWAKSQGAIGWELLGRDGWDRIIKKVLNKSGVPARGSYTYAKFGE